MILRVAAWVAQSQTSILLARSEAIRLCLAAFDAAAIVMPEPTFRVLGGSSTPSAPAEPPTAPVPPPAEAQEVDTSAEAALERIVTSERASQRQEDLLDRDAPEE